MGQEPPPKKIPKTLESLREPDETVVDEADEETAFDLQNDVFSTYFNKSYVPKVLITSSANPSLVSCIIFFKEENNQSFLKI